MNNVKKSSKQSVTKTILVIIIAFVATVVGVLGFYNQNFGVMNDRPQNIVGESNQQNHTGTQSSANEITTDTEGVSENQSTDNLGRPEQENGASDKDEPIESNKDMEKRQDNIGLVMGISAFIIGAVVLGIIGLISSKKRTATKKAIFFEMVIIVMIAGIIGIVTSVSIAEPVSNLFKGQELSQQQQAPSQDDNQEYIPDSFNDSHHNEENSDDNNTTQLPSDDLIIADEDLADRDEIRILSVEDRPNDYLTAVLYGVAGLCIMALIAGLISVLGVKNRNAVILYNDDVMEIEQ